MPTPLERFFEAAECRTQVELADFLGIRQSSVSDAKKRSKIPAEWLMTLLRFKSVNPEWILTGEGAIYLLPVDYSERPQKHIAYKREVKPPDECTIEELMLEIVRRAIKADLSCSQD